MSISAILQGTHIDKSNSIPLYIQVRDILKDRINTGALNPGDQLPSENEISSAFNISRMTVRQAIQELIREGFINIRRGEGTFVNSAPRTQMLLKLDGFSAEMAKLGYSNHSRILDMDCIEAYDSFEMAYSGLSLPAGEPIVRIRRIRYLEDTPFALESSYLPYDIGKGLVKPAMADDMSIYNYIENTLHIRLARADHVIQPDLSDTEIAKHLEINHGEAILKLHGTTFSMQNKPVEYLEGIYRGDKYELKVVITK